MTVIKGSVWKLSTKGDDLVHFELWNGADTDRIIDGDLGPDQAYNVGRLFMDAAIKQGYDPNQEKETLCPTTE